LILIDAQQGAERFLAKLRASGAGLRFRTRFPRSRGGVELFDHGQQDKSIL
jgi:hypothetical protein